MKNIYDILTEIGLEVPEDKKEVFNTAVSENYKTVAEVEKIKTARDNYKSQLDTAQETLKGFEGVDVKDLQGKITALQNDLAAKETDYQNKLSDMEFNSALEAAISGSGAKNAKAVKALLDMDALKASKNRSEDIKAALEEVKKENDYLFGSDEPFYNPVGDTGGKGGNLGGSAMDAMRAAMGLPALK